MTTQSIGGSNASVSVRFPIKGSVRLINESRGRNQSMVGMMRMLSNARVANINTTAAKMSNNILLVEYGQSGIRSGMVDVEFPVFIGPTNKRRPFDRDQGSECINYVQRQ